VRTLTLTIYGNGILLSLTVGSLGRGRLAQRSFIHAIDVDGNIPASDFTAMGDGPVFPFHKSILREAWDYLVMRLPFYGLSFSCTHNTGVWLFQRPSGLESIAVFFFSVANSALGPYLNTLTPIGPFTGCIGNVSTPVGLTRLVRAIPDKLPLHSMWAKDGTAQIPIPWIRFRRTGRQPASA
jgi:hypothetical protein